MSPERQTRLLRIGAAMITLSGVLVILGAHPITAWPLHLVADLFFWPPDGRQAGTADETRMLAAIGGGVMIGWGVMIWQLAGPLLTLAPGPVRRVLMTSCVVWFTTDTAASVVAGALGNVVGNLVFLALFLSALRPATAPERAVFKG